MWYNFLNDAFKRKVVRYGINRVVGPYLESGGVLTDQLSVGDDIWLRDVGLNCAAINELLEKQGLQLELLDGFIGDLSVTIPWTNLLAESCFVTIDHLTVTMQVRQRDHPTQISASIFHSMCESFSAKHMAEDCLKFQGEEELKEIQGENLTPEAPESTTGEKVLGVELLTQAFDSIINRIKFKLKNTTFRLEFVPNPLECKGLALEIKVGTIMYAGGANDETSSSTSGGKKSSPRCFLRKAFIEDVCFYSDHFSFNKKEDKKTQMSKVEQNSRDSFESEDDSDEEEEDGDEDGPEPPLQIAKLTGKQELIVRFSETNQYGLPRSIEDVELNLGGIVVQVFPHQIHTMTEIIAAAAVPPEKPPSSAAEMEEKRRETRMAQRFENLIHESMILPHTGRVDQWSDANSFMSSSSDFQSVVAGQLSMTDSMMSATAAKVPFPRITVTFHSLVCVLQEKDPLVAKLGGHEDEDQARKDMKDAVDAFFGVDISYPDVNSLDHLNYFADQVRQRCLTPSASYLSLTALPVTLCYQESASTSVTLGQASLYEVVCGTEVELISFPRSDSEKANVVGLTDVHINYTETKAGTETEVEATVSIKLRPFHAEIDPGLYDRTYLLLNYAELNPGTATLRKGGSSSTSPTTKLDVKISVPYDNVSSKLKFRIPKADLRPPEQIQNFTENYWHRRVHPESLSLELTHLEFGITFHDVTSGNPLEIRVSALSAEVSYQESPGSDVVNLIRVRKSSKERKMKMDSAANIYVTVNLDEDTKLKGKFCSVTRSQKRRTESDELYYRSAASGSFYVSAAGTIKGGEEDSQNNLFTKQIPHINEALDFSKRCNNLLVDIRLDEVSFLLPSKHVYEVVYNRLGNDLILWKPEIFRVKEYLYNQPLPDPLQDPDLGFSACFTPYQLPSIQAALTVNHEEESDDEEGEKDSARETPFREKPSYSSFPQDSSSELLIHIDTCVRLRINKAQATIVTSPYEDVNSFALLAEVRDLELTSAVGLEADPSEITIFRLGVGAALVKFGTCNHQQEFENLHFNTHPPGNLEPLLRPTPFKGRAWAKTLEANQILKLTAKILFDSKTNLKTISLAFAFGEASILFKSLVTAPDWVDWLANFFVVVEYPVDGYIPPAILTHMQFDLRHCSLDLVPTNHGARLSLCLGRAKVACNILEDPIGRVPSSGGDAMGSSILQTQFDVHLEELGLFLASSERDNPICLADLDYLDVEVHTVEGGYTDVALAGNLIRVRTCPDALLLLSGLFSAMAVDSTQESDPENSRESSEEPVLTRGVEEEDMVPDLADAMEELISQEEQARRERMKKRSKKKGGVGIRGTQVFFFADERNMTNSMTQSMYEEFPSEESLDDFEIIEEEAVRETRPNAFRTPRVNNRTRRKRKKQKKRSNSYKTEVQQEKDDHFVFRFRIMPLSVSIRLFSGIDFGVCDVTSIAVDSKGHVLVGQEAHEYTRTHEREELDRKRLSKGLSRLELTEDIKLRGGPGRNVDQSIELCIHKINFTHEDFSDGSSGQRLTVQTYEIKDKLVNSDINKLLHLYTTKARPPQTQSPMLELCLSHKPASPEEPLDMIDTSIYLSMQSIRLNMDQDTLFFLRDFGSALTDPDKNFLQLSKESGSQQMSLESNQQKPLSKGVRYSKEDVIEVRTEEEETELGEEVYEDANSSSGSPVSIPGSPPAREGHQQLKRQSGSSSSSVNRRFIKSFIFRPEVHVRIDYSAKYVDLSQGTLAGLLTGLASLNCSELTLREVSVEGVLGLHRLCKKVVEAWTEDIKNNQIPRLLGGVGPMHSVLQLLQGLRDLVVLPLEQYQKDGRLIKGLQMGANRFTSSTAVSILELTHRLLGAVRFVAEIAFDVMSPEALIVTGHLEDHSHPRHKRRGEKRQGRRLRRRRPPQDLREGVISALDVVRRGVEDTTTALTNAARAEQLRGRGTAGMVGGVLRQVPAALVARPVICVAEAGSNVIEGVQGSVAPDFRKQEQEKWKQMNDQED